MLFANLRYILHIYIYGVYPNINAEQWSTLFISYVEIVERKCSSFGQWEPRPGQRNLTNNIGWTNYTICFTPEMSELYKMLQEGGNKEVSYLFGKVFVFFRQLNDSLLAVHFADCEEHAHTRNCRLQYISFGAARVAHHLLRLSVNFRCAIVWKLCILMKCLSSSLRNNRTRIHKNLFVAMFIQVVIRLTLYLDQAIIRDGDASDLLQGIDNTVNLTKLWIRFVLHWQAEWNENIMYTS